MSHCSEENNPLFLSPSPPYDLGQQALISLRLVIFRHQVASLMIANPWCSTEMALQNRRSMFQGLVGEDVRRTAGIISVGMEHKQTAVNVDRRSRLIVCF